MSGNTGLTHSQSQIWVGQRLDRDSPLYNMAFAFLFAAELDPDLFCRAWQLVIDRSDALRSRIRETDAGAPQCVVADRGRTTEVIDLGRPVDAEDAFRDWCRERCSRPLETDGDLVDSVLIRLGDGRTGWYLNQHHLVTDAWSTLLLYRQVASAYEALQQLSEVEAPELPSYYETAAELPPRRGEREKAHSYWASRWERPGRIVSLYGEGGAPHGTASRRLTLRIDGERSRALDRLAELPELASLSPDLSRFAVFAALMTAWLNRISGQSDPGFDAPVAGRPTAAAKQALGVFIEMFPFCVRVESGDTFRSLGSRCLEEAKQYLAHALPGLSAPSGATAGSIVLNYVPGAFGTFAGVPVEVEWVHPGHGDRVHALRLQVHDLGGSGGYVLHFDGNEAALPERLHRRGVEQFERLFDALLADPDREIASIDVRIEDERQALASLNATDSGPLPGESVIERFFSCAAEHGDRIALRQGRSELTFAALGDQVEALAWTLIDRGLEPEDRVAILSRRSIPAVVGILAALRARLAYVPIDPAAPASRREQMLRDAGIRLVLAQEDWPRDSLLGLDVLSLEEGIHQGGGRELDAALPQLEDLAYLLYTSGSTGRPKGVLIEHAGLADYLEWADRRYVRGDRLAFPLFTSLGFDLTVTSLFLPLITGGTLEIYPESSGPVDTALKDVVEANAVDFIKLTPSHLSLLRRMGLEGSRIRRMVVGGEDFRTSLANAISEQLHHRVEIHNEYGPTEAVVGCVAHRFDPQKDRGISVPIGMPADHVAVEILNEALCPVPVGVPGELWISRYGLARGYHRMNEQTAESFRRHRESPGGRRYRSGDLVRLSPAGELEYLGRIDRQLKVAGFRVEPGEIEAALLSLPGIEQCAVVSRRLAPSPSASPAETRSCVRCGLPSDYPRTEFDEEGVCSLCHGYDAVKEHARSYFLTMDDLRAVFADAAARTRSEYDCMMLYSGGKDSTYALCRLVEMGLSVYAFTLDNGFISDGAKDNIRKVSEQLGVPVEFATTPAMNAIFKDSLKRFSNVCNGCFKTIYTLSMLRARELRIPIIVTGLSRGQMFETRLTEEMFRDGERSPEEVDAAVLAARKVYHRLSDEVSRSLDVEPFEDDGIFEEIRFVDFYRYCDVDMDELYSYLERRVPWVRPADTGRSTNCLINDVGIYIHKKERGFHNYALPYSWDVRMGHKTRDEALEELDDEIDLDGVRRMLDEIDYDEDRLAGDVDRQALEAFYVTSGELSEATMRRRLGELLPPQLIPARLQRIDAIPLTASGKVDEPALLRRTADGSERGRYRPPEGPVQEFLCDVWEQELRLERVGAGDSFFELGGTSLSAMQVMLQLCREFDIDLPLDTLFTHPTLAGLARVAEDRILADVAEMSEADG